MALSGAAPNTRRVLISLRIKWTTFATSTSSPP
jgi:hypothetical protein